jgi:hypothetical protein
MALGALQNLVVALQLEDQLVDVSGEGRVSRFIVDVTILVLFGGSEERVKLVVFNINGSVEEATLFE